MFKLLFAVAITFVALWTLDFNVSADDADFEGASGAFAKALERGESSVDIGEFNVSKDDVGFLLQYSQSENPEIFWYPASVSYTFFEEDGVVSELSWENVFDDFSEIVQMKSELDVQLREAISVCFSMGMTDFEKILSAHEYLTERTVYKMTDDFSFTTYSVFVRGEGVCQGYSYAFKYLMDYAGIECYCVSSAELNHGWNIVLLDGEYYHIDVTFDDAVPTYNGVEINIGREIHKKLLCSDEAFGCEANDVVLWGLIPLPECESTLYDNAFFKDVVGTMEFLNGKWYYIEPNEYINGSRKVLRTSFEQTEIFFEADKAVYSIESYGGSLFCAVKDVVYKIETSGEKERFCYTVGEIFGITVKNNNLYYGVYRKKSFALCSVALPINIDCIDGISMNVSSDEFLLNVFVKVSIANENAVIRYVLGDKETEIGFKDISADGVLTIPLSKELLCEEISLVCDFEESERAYKISVKNYLEIILDGNYDEEIKAVAKTLMNFCGMSGEKIPENAFSGYENVLYDNSNEISYVKSEISLQNGFSAKIKFSVIGNADFSANIPIKIEKDGLYCNVSVECVSIYNLNKTITVKSDGIEFRFSALGFASELDEKSQAEIYFAFQYGNALNEYRKIK